MRLCLLALLLLCSCARRYRVEGLVAAVDPVGHTITVSHQAIPGYMPAMVMPFRLGNPADIQKVRPGVRVRFDLAHSVARNLRVIGAKQDFVPSAPAAKLAMGQLVPDFELIDQNSKPVRLSDFHGTVVALDFIYTRCPLPDVCPRLSAGFAYVARQINGQDLILLSVTVDPEYDRPEILSEYAHRWAADPQRWHFLTGTMDNIRDVAGRFGLVFWPEENMIAHTVVTAVIDRQGRLAALIDGASYKPRELRDLILSTLSTTR